MSPIGDAAPAGPEGGVTWVDTWEPKGDTSERADARVVDLETALREALAMPYGPARTQAMSRLGDLVRTGRDVDRLLRIWSASTARADRDPLLQGLVAGWAKFAPSDAAAWVLTESGRSLSVARMKQALIGRVAARWAEDDPAGAVAWAAGLAEAALRTTALQAVVSGWSAKDPASAVAWIGSAALPPDEAANLLRSTVSRWANTDAEAAWAYLQRQPDGAAALADLRPTVLASLAGTDIRRAMELAGQLPDGAEPGLYLRMFSFWRARNRDADVGVFLDAVPAGRLDDSARAAIASALAREDPARAVSLAESIVDPVLRSRSMAQLATAMAEIDPAAAVGLVGRCAPGAEADQARASLAGAMVEIDLAAAQGLVAAIDDPARRTQAATSVAQRWAASDPAAATEWFFGLTREGAGSAETLRNLLQTWAWSSEKGPEQTREWIMAQGADQPVEVLAVMVERLARADAGSAVQFAMSLPAGDAGDRVRKVAYEMVIRQVARTDGRQAASMIETSEVALDPVVIAETIYNWAGQAPAEAAAWAASRLAEGSAERSRAESDIYVQWRARDRASAEAWIQSVRAGRIQTVIPQ